MQPRLYLTHTNNGIMLHAKIYQTFTLPVENGEMNQSLINKMHSLISKWLSNQFSILIITERQFSETQQSSPNHYDALYKIIESQSTKPNIILLADRPFRQLFHNAESSICSGIEIKPLSTLWE